MPLILVIVADPHEAAQLATLIQGRLSVDLVQAAEVGEGLLALDDRIPDLILTSPLMSPFDDGVLDEYLRDLGSAGAHVQTLRIPVLSQTPKKTKRLGFSLRRSKPEAPTTTGCDPKVFADEIEQYLARAAEEKGRVESNDQPVVVDRQAAFAEPETAEQQWTAAYSADEPVANASWSAPEPEPETPGWRADLLDRPPIEEETPIYQPVAYEENAVAYEENAVACEETAVAYEETPAPYESAVNEDVTPQYEPIAPENEPATSEYEAVAAEYESAATEYEEPATEAIAAEDEQVSAAPMTTTWPEEVLAEPIAESTAEPELPVATVEPEAPVEAPMVTAPHRPAPPAIDEKTESPSFKAALAAIRAAWGKPPRQPELQQREPEEAAVAQPQPMVAATEAPAAFDVDLTDEVVVLDEGTIEVENDVYELSVDPDQNEYESQPVAPVAEPREPQASKPAPAGRAVEERKAVDSTPQPAADSNGESKKKGKRVAKGAKAKAQNEWGIFDPNQCGFAALVDKLDEVADEKTERRQNGGKARVISLS